MIGVLLVGRFGCTGNLILGSGLIVGRILAPRIRYGLQLHFLRVWIRQLRSREVYIFFSVRRQVFPLPEGVWPGVLPSRFYVVSFFVDKAIRIFLEIYIVIGIVGVFRF